MSSPSTPTTPSTPHPFEHSTSKLEVIRDHIDVEEESRLYDQLYEVRCARSIDVFQRLTFEFLCRIAIGTRAPARRMSASPPARRPYSRASRSGSGITMGG